jgi:YcxB-like protein
MSTAEGAAGMPAGGPPRFELRFHLDWKDYVEALQRLPYTGIERATLFLFGAGVLALGILLGALVWQILEMQFALSARHTGLGLSISISAAALLLFCYYVLWPVQFRSACADLPTAYGECRLVADEQGVTLSVVGIALFAPWKAIRQIEETRAHLALLYTERSSFVVPKRSFGGAAQSAGFLTFARARQASA